MRRSRLVRAVVLLVLLAIPLVSFGGRALAIVGPEYKVLFGPIGVGVGQGARINVYGLGSTGIAGTVPHVVAAGFGSAADGGCGATLGEGSGGMV